MGPPYPTPCKIFTCLLEYSSDGHSHTNYPSESRLHWLSSLRVSGPVPDSCCHRGFCILQVTLILICTPVSTLPSGTCKCAALNVTNPKQNVLTLLKGLCIPMIIVITWQILLLLFRTIRVSESESPRFLATQSSGVTNSTEKEIPVLLPEGILNVGTKIDEAHSVVTSYQCTMLP